MVNKNHIIFLAALLLDQLLKSWIVISKPSIDLYVFAITFVKNTGAVWGFFQDSNTLFIWISLIAIGLLLYYYDSLPENSYLYFVLVLGGIVGNLIDRIFRGFVVDFIDFKFWPVFNIADAAIVVGIIGLIFYVWKEEDNSI